MLTSSVDSFPGKHSGLKIKKHCVGMNTLSNGIKFQNKLNLVNPHINLIEICDKIEELCISEYLCWDAEGFGRLRSDP